MSKVLIRPLEINDSLISFRWRNDPDIWLFTGSKPDRYVTAEMETEWIHKVLADSSSKRFAILVDDVYVGNVQLTSVTDRDAEFHIFIGVKSYWGKGVASRATYQILHYAKNILKLDNVYLNVNSENTKAISSYLKIGFSTVLNKHESITMVLDLSKLAIPTVSVFVLVYNHGKYLEECLTGILNQDTDFNFDINVGEDCSTDNSRSILQNYQLKYPGKFNLLLHDSNIGAVKNQNAVHRACKGEFIATCEGDDYWTDSSKLQRQVDYLRENVDCNLVYHRVMVYNEESKSFSSENLNVEDYETKKDLNTLTRYGNFIHTPSVLFRNNIDFNSPLFIGFVGDYILWYLNGEKGLFGYIPNYMAVYRFWNGGAWSKEKRSKTDFLFSKFLLKLRNHIKSREIRENIRLQAVDRLVGVGFSDLTIQDRIKFSLLMLSVDPRLCLNLIKRILIFSKIIK